MALVLISRCVMAFEYHVACCYGGAAKHIQGCVWMKEDTSARHSRCMQGPGLLHVMATQCTVVFMVPQAVTEQHVYPGCRLAVAGPPTAWAALHALACCSKLPHASEHPHSHHCASLRFLACCPLGPAGAPTACAAHRHPRLSGTTWNGTSTLSSPRFSELFFMLPCRCLHCVCDQLISLTSSATICASSVRSRGSS